MVPHAFRDRRDAGRQLARRLLGFSVWHPVVVGIARGGVVVAGEVARALQAPLDVLIVKKVSAPSGTDRIIGATGEDDVMVLDWPAIDLLNVRAYRLGLAVEAAKASVRDATEHLRAGRDAIPVHGRTVLVVDDRLEAGVCARAAAEILHRRGARHTVLAVPSGTAEAIGRLDGQFDDVVAIVSTPDPASLEETYGSRAPLTDREVVAELLGGVLDQHRAG